MDEKTKLMPVLQHLDQLRRVLIVSLSATTALAIVAYFYSDRLMALLVIPVSNLGYKVVFTGVAEAFLVKIKISLLAGLIAALPIILWEIWSFVAPALKRNERICFAAFVLVSFLFFVGGVTFAYLAVYKLGVMVLLGFSGPLLTPMLSVDRYLSFTVGFLLPFGVVFELPLVSYFLARFGLISYHFLSAKRKYALIVVVIVAAVVTPTPDLVTCSLVSAPLYVLYETSIWVVRLTEAAVSRRRKRLEKQELSDAHPAN